MPSFKEIFLAGLGMGYKADKKTGSAAPMDTGTILAHDRTDLAMERTYWAADRTLMAWIRTALSMISFGFTIGKIGQAVHEVEVKGLRGLRQVGVDNIAKGLVILGTVSLLIATIQYSFRVYRLYKQGLSHEVSLPFIVSILLIFVGGFALISLVTNL